MHLNSLTMQVTRANTGVDDEQDVFAEMRDMDPRMQQFCLRIMQQTQ
jgi:hypothetical protein